MDVKTRPTSPKIKAEANNAAMSKVWNDQHLDQPRRLPWFGLIVVMIIVNIIVTSGLLFSWGWLARNAPHMRWLTWLPTATSTTVVQPVKTTTTLSTMPLAVSQTLDQLFSLALDQGRDGHYTAVSTTGLAVPLSTNGWLLSLAEAQPSGTTVALSPAGGVDAVATRVNDPASPFVFLKTTSLDVAPLDLSSDRLDVGQTVWVVAGTLNDMTAVSRTTVGRGGPRWASADRQETYWQLDQPATAPLGAPVLNTAGQVVGLLGANGRVWSVDSLTALVPGVLQTGKVNRPSFGFRFLMLSEAVSPVAGQDNGALVGADQGDQAVTAKSPADKAGLISGDTILSVDQHQLQTDLSLVLQTYKPGDQLHLTVKRGTKDVNVTLTVGRLAS